MANFWRYPSAGGEVTREVMNSAMAYAGEADALARTATDMVVTPKSLDGFSSVHTVSISVSDGVTKTVTAARHGFDIPDITVETFETIDANTRKEIEIDVEIDPITFDVTLSRITPFDGVAVLSGN